MGFTTVLPNKPPSVLEDYPITTGPVEAGLFAGTITTAKLKDSEAWQIESVRSLPGHCRSNKTKGHSGCLGVYIYIHVYIYILGGGFKHPKIGEMIQFDEHIFQMGWFNHQSV